MTDNHVTVESPEHLQQVLSKDLNRVSVLYFRADWAEPCRQMDNVTSELAKRNPSVLFLSIEAEALPDISESFEVDAVPYFVLLRGHTLLQRLSGAQPTVLSNAITTHSQKPASGAARSSAQPKAAGGTYDPSSAPGAAKANSQVLEKESIGSEESDEELEKRCEKLMKLSDLVLFMKGDREVPRCGFSQKIVGILNDLKLDYTTFDILQDEGVRQKLKEMNDWPTFPQLIVKGEFVGGLDVVKEMVENGELQEMLQ